MKLISCEIEQFGTLSHEKLEFQPGLNCIIKENGWGKTTFAAFVQAMFYGMDSGRKNDLREAERRHYKPWKGGNYGGSLIFQVEDRTYRIERYFASTMKEDQFSLYDQVTGLPSHDYDANIGEVLFGMNKEAYSASTYIPQAGTGFHPNDSLTARLSQESGSNPEMDMNRYSDAVKRLKAGRQELIKVGKKGRIWELRNQLELNREGLKKISELTDILNQRKKEEQRHNQLELQQKEELGKLKAQIRQQSVAERRNVVTKQLEEMKKKVTRAGEELREMELFFQNGVPQEETIVHYKELQSKWEEALHEAEIYGLTPQELETVNEKLPDESEMESIKQKLQETSQIKDSVQKKQQEVTEYLVRTGNQQSHHIETPKKSSQIGYMIVSVVLILAGIVIGIAVHPAGYIIGILSGIALLIYGSRKARVEEQEQRRKQDQEQEELNKNREECRRLEEELAHVKQQLQTKEQNLIQIFRKYGWGMKEGYYEDYMELERKREQQQMLLQRNKQEQQALETAGKLKEQIMTFLLGFYPQPEAGIGFYLTDISNRKRDYRQKENSYHQSVREMEQYSLEHHEDLTEKMDETLPSLLTLQQSQEKLEFQIQENQQEMRENHLKMEELEEQMNEQQELQADIDREEEELEECEHRLFVIDQTAALLEEAKNRYAKHYLGGIQQGFSHYMDCLSDKKLGEPVIDVGLQVSFREEGGTREIGYYSAGYQDLIGICARLALVDAIFEQEKPFLVLDDPFVNLDEKKMKDAQNILKDLGSRYQVIYLVCHQNRA